MLQRRGLIRAAGRAALLVGLAALLGCGDVYSGLDVAQQKTIDPDFSPAEVARGSVVALLMTVEGVTAVGTPQVISTGIDDGDLGLEWYQGLDFVPGPCADADGNRGAEVTNAFGDLIFCGVVKVGDPALDALTIRVVVNNGVESFEGFGKLEVQ